VIKRNTTDRLVAYLIKKLEVYLMAYGAGATGFDGSFILFLILILLVFGMTPFFGKFEA